MGFGTSLFLLAVGAILKYAVTASVAAGKDDYVRDEFVPSQATRFGLRDNEHRVMSLGFDAMPTEQAFLNALMDACHDVPQVAFVLVMINSEIDERR